MAAVTPPKSMQDAMELVQGYSPRQLEEAWRLVEEHAARGATAIWLPQSEPQQAALNCEADELFYGGQAGGGKTDLIIGAALTRHYHSIIYRREATQLEGIVQRMEGLLRGRDGYNGTSKIWVPRIPGDDTRRVVEFGSTPNLGNELRYQGRPHDLIGFDEICNFLEAQFRFLKGWLRSAEGHRSRVICAGNPPTTSDGVWVTEYWGPWLLPDRQLGKLPRAQPGELLYFTTGEDGKDMLCDGPDPVVVRGKSVRPKSRTFIPSSVEDNYFLLRSGYLDQLAALPEPLRSQMMEGDFSAGLGGDPWQVCPTAWVDAAMARWKPRPEGKGPMTALGCDVARGGRDKTVLAPRHGLWFDELDVHPGSDTPNGPIVAGLAVGRVRNGATIFVDIIGWGASVVDQLALNHVPHVGVNFATKEDPNEPPWMDESGQLRLANKRALCYWRLREALNPENEELLALPPGKDLRTDLCSPRWSFGPRGVMVESKEDIQKRIGRSTDEGDAVALAFDDDTYVRSTVLGPKVLKLHNPDA